jgi:hypothetical protein
MIGRSLTIARTQVAAVACGLVLLLAGCSNRVGPPHLPHYSFAAPGMLHNPCFGFHSTCWRPWPVECPVCPAPVVMHPTLGSATDELPMPPGAMHPPANGP